MELFLISFFAVCCLIHFSFLFFLFHTGFQSFVPQITWNLQPRYVSTHRVTDSFPLISRKVWESEEVQLVELWHWQLLRKESIQEWFQTNTPNTPQKPTISSVINGQRAEQHADSSLWKAQRCLRPAPRLNIITCHYFCNQWRKTPLLHCFTLSFNGALEDFLFWPCWQTRSSNRHWQIFKYMQNCVKTLCAKSVSALHLSVSSLVNFVFVDGSFSLISSLKRKKIIFALLLSWSECILLVLCQTALPCLC